MNTKEADGHWFSTLGRRHGRLLSFTGALIIFVTFIVKEGKQAELKGEAQSVEVACQTFDIRRDISSDHNQLILLETSSNEFQTRVAQQPKGAHADSTEDQTRSTSHTVKARLDLIRSLNQNTEGLFEWVRGSNASKTHAELETAKNDLEQMTNTWKQLEEERQREPKRTDGGNDDGSPEEAERLRDKYEDLESKTEVAQNDAVKRGNAAYQEAINFRNRDQRSYSNYSELSVGLYALGWSLTFAGRIFGIKELADVE